jgi:hypothetical protein
LLRCCKECGCDAGGHVNSNTLTGCASENAQLADLVAWLPQHLQHSSTTQATDKPVVEYDPLLVKHSGADLLTHECTQVLDTMTVTTCCQKTAEQDA